MPATALSYQKASVSVSAAQRIVEAGIAKATDLDVPVTIAVVDESGHLKAFARMDGAGLIATDVALNKAYTSAATGAPTSGVHQFISSDPGSLLSMPHLPRFTVVAGGIPIGVDGATVGAVGVSGGSPEVDDQIAEAAVEAPAGE
ncbi:MAG: GlcG/HbpS family heme-binding protein [Gammaproteobacteria bacterium]